MIEENNKTNSKKYFEDNLELRTNDRLNEIKERKGYFYYLLNPTFPNIQKKLDKIYILKFLNRYEKILPDIKKLIKKLRGHVENIWDQNKFVAAYLIMCKVFNNIKIIISLAKKGENFEVIELIRSGQESLDLAFLLLEDDQQENLKKWFSGKIIENSQSRAVLDKAINSNKKEGKYLPFEDLKNRIYRTFSLFTHSSYSALLDKVDVFKEDFDFEKHAGFHYTKKNLDMIDGLIVNTIIQFKDIFLKCNDLEGFNMADNLLKKIGFVGMSEKDVNLAFKK